MVVTVIVAHLSLSIPLPQAATPSFSKVQVTLPPGPIQVGPERVYLHILTVMLIPENGLRYGCGPLLRPRCSPQIIASTVSAKGCKLAIH